MSSQGDLFAGRAARDAGMALTEEGQEDWFTFAYIFVANLPHGWQGTGEDLRFLIREKIGPPRSVQSWGNLVMHVKRDAILIEIDTVQMKDKRSHARRTPLYRRR